MREIKFRGKFLDDTSEWVYGNYFFIKRDIFKHKIIDSTGLVLDIKEDTLGQYTGLHDKNGKEIYEGDIVKANWFDKEDVIGEICFSMGCFILANSSVSDNQLFIFKNYEVIGNIYDNPELLKEDNK